MTIWLAGFCITLGLELYALRYQRSGFDPTSGLLGGLLLATLWPIGMPYLLYWIAKERKFT